MTICGRGWLRPRASRSHLFQPIEGLTARAIGHIAGELATGRRYIVTARFARVWDWVWARATDFAFTDLDFAFDFGIGM